MDHVEYAYTYGMDDATVDERLRTSQTGVLSLSKDSDTYAIPLAYFYDGENLYFRLGSTGESKKREFLETTETASFVLYDTEPTTSPDELESWSILVTGRLNEVPKSAHDRFDTATINRDFTPARVFDEAIEDIELTIVELEIETMTGRSTSLE
ncbi:pyridoxamine 5'-phosphate oxidase family protein [Natronobiforma cellulositropha]|uniref:pyridoxamine 5'-phosphate oxidase family protein n=1 Tax=Natronobiforma cellulositropha TaxID=1679076 RepID=UPI0021D5D62D|nr:pyridoxamine 5'-phosphate oxidase family protein [Natronobiforma cellulositropha]